MICFSEGVISRILLEYPRVWRVEKDQRVFIVLPKHHWLKIRLTDLCLAEQYTMLWAGHYIGIDTFIMPERNIELSLRIETPHPRER